MALTGNGSFSFKCLIEERIAAHRVACQILGDRCTSSGPLLASNEEGTNGALPSERGQGDSGVADEGLHASFSFERESMCLIGALDFLLHFFPATFFKYTGYAVHAHSSKRFVSILTLLPAVIIFIAAVIGCPSCAVDA